MAELNKKLKNPDTANRRYQSAGKFTQILYGSDAKAKRVYRTKFMKYYSKSNFNMD